MASARVGPRDVELGGGDVADAALGDELWRCLVEQLLERSVVLVDLGVEELDPSSERSHRAAGGAFMDGTAGTVAELRACGDLPGGAQSAQLARSDSSAVTIIAFSSLIAPVRARTAAALVTA